MESPMVMGGSSCLMETIIKDKLNMVEQMGLEPTRQIHPHIRGISKTTSAMGKARKRVKGISSADSISMDKRSRAYTNIMGMCTRATFLMAFLAAKGN